MPKSEWHFPRTAFAERLHTLLIESPTSAISLFGPRRTGKTEFLIDDLIPLARKKKHRVVYLSLWRTVDSPLATILHSFDAALRGGNLGDRVGTAIRDLGPKLKLKPPGTGAEMEIDVGALRGKPQDNHLLLLDQYCDRLANEEHPTILLFDEFQELATSEDTASIVAALRTSLDTRKRSLVSVFTGSSQEGLRKMFSAKDAPFYRFATQTTLPQLGDDFVDHQLGVFKSKAKRKIDRDDALRIFREVEHNPLFFQQWLIALMAYEELNADTAVAHVLDELGTEFGFAAIWEKLGSLDRATLRMLAEDSPQIYTEAVAAKMAKLTNQPRPSGAKVQASVRKLSRYGAIEKVAKDWQIQDPLFGTWTRSRAVDEFS
ncbi:MAG: ATP-binding protein [Pseudomonadota bacterium]